MSQEPRHLLSLEEAADRLGISIRTLRRRITDGDLTGYRLGPRLIRVDAAEIDLLLQQIPTVQK